jgi:hypothetical protein
VTDFGSGKGRRKGVGTPMIAWVVAGAVLLALGGGGWAFIKISEHNSEQQALAAQEVTHAFGQVLDDDETVVIDPRPKADGAAGAIEKAAKILCRHMAEDDRAMDREIEALDVDKETFDSTTDLGLDSLGTVSDQVKKARKVVARYRALRHSRVAQFRAAVEHAQMSLADKETMLKRFNRALDWSFYDSDKLWRTRDEVLRINADLLTALEETRGQGRPTPYGVVFTNQDGWRRVEGLRWKLRDARWNLREMNSKGLSNARNELEAAATTLDP